MSKEFRLPTEGLQNFVTNYAERLAKKPTVKKIARKAGGWLMSTGSDFYEYNGAEESISELRPLLESGHKLVILSSHKSHGEIAPGAHVMEEFMEAFPEYIDEFIIPVAASMAGGQQGSIVKTLYEDALVPYVTPKRIKPILVVTDNDVNKRNLVKPRTNGFGVVRALKNKRSALFAFIEGSIEGGKRIRKLEK